MGKFAADTAVPVEKSRAEIETLLRRYGADQFFSGWEEASAFVAFRARGRFVRFVLPLPKQDEFKTYMVRGWQKTRTPEQQRAAWEQEMRRRWRALALTVKAKLEAVDAGIEDFESAFLAQIQMPDGSTFGTWAKVAIAAVYETGRALPAHVEGDEEPTP